MYDLCDLKFWQQISEQGKAFVVISVQASVGNISLREETVDCKQQSLNCPI